MDLKTQRIRAFCGAGAGLLFGVLFAPGVQWRLHRFFGVDAGSVGPGIAIIAAITAIGGYAGWATTRRSPG